LAEGSCFLVFPKAVVKRLFDRSGWSQKQVVFTVTGKICALVSLFLIVFTPLKLGTSVFTVGTIFTGLGLLGLMADERQFMGNSFVNGVRSS